MWLNPKERTVEENLRMFTGSWEHNKIQSLLDPNFCEKKVVFPYKDICLVSKADYLPPERPDQVYEFKTSSKLMQKSKPYHDFQVKIYCSIFGKQQGIVYQPVQNKDGIYLKQIGSVERDDIWFQEQLRLLYIFHEKVERLYGETMKERSQQR